MKLISGIFLICSLFLLGSCIEIFDDLTINADGSGTFKYNINLSSSKLKINSMLALDSLDGKKVPSIIDIQEEIKRLKEKLEGKEGISHVSIETDFENFLFKLNCNFANVDDLQTAIKEIIAEEKFNNNVEELSGTWISWENQVLTRSIPEYTPKLKKELTPNEIDLLSQGKYTSITRFDRPIEKFENPSSKLSASKMAIMLQTNTYSLLQNTKLLENTITLIPLKE